MKYLFPLLLLTACNQATTQAPAPVASSTNFMASSGVSDPSFKLPDGNGCSAVIARFKATIKNDLETGHTTKGVHDNMLSDLRGADSACASGNDGGASSMVRGVRGKYGYPAS